ncbi:MAG: DegT/DnrJ/EryC1/StrS family aminotransferase [Candidatus Bathyarchaeia archaeon]
MHLQPPYLNMFRDEKYPVAEYLSSTGMNLPSGNTLSKEDIEYIVDCIRTIIKAKK